MARIYSRRKGKSGSKKPIKKAKPSWVAYDNKITEQLVVKFAKAGKNASEVGVILRDSYGIPDVKILAKKTIGKILEENNLKPKIPDDLRSLIKKDIIIMKHLEANKHDMTAKRGLILTESKIGRLARYYKGNGKLPRDWIYDRTKAKVLIE